MQSIKKIFLCFLILLLIGLAKNEAYAQGPNPTFTGNAGSEVSGTYTVTMKKMEISTDKSTWVTLGESTQAFNIAGSAPGVDVGSYLSNSSIPAGTYNYLRITQSRTIIIKGRGEYPASSETYYYTTTQNGTFGAEGFYKATADSGQYEAVSFIIPDGATGEEGEDMTLTDTDMIVVKDLSATPIIIGEGATRGMVMSFNTAEMIGFETIGEGEYIFYPMAPSSDYSEE